MWKFLINNFIWATHVLPQNWTTHLFLYSIFVFKQYTIPSTHGFPADTSYHRTKTAYPLKSSFYGKISCMFVFLNNNSKFPLNYKSYMNLKLRFMLLRIIPNIFHDFLALATITQSLPPQLYSPVFPTLFC